LIRFSGLALLALCFMAGHATAQVFEGKFTLPSPARWGGATLPAGDYSFTLNNVPTTCTLRLYRERDAVGLFSAQSLDESYSGHAELTVVRGTVTSLNLPDIGIVLKYAPQRIGIFIKYAPHPKGLTAPKEPELAQLVPVAAAGK
jgi:hypothetical protein